jgi:hypothetical protein
LAELDLLLCGAGVRLRAEDSRFLAAARRRYATFLGRGGAPLDVELCDRTFRPDMDEPSVERDGATLRVLRHDLELEVGRRGGRARIVRGASPLDSLLRIWTSLALARRGGFLCHAAAVDGWLFPGRSGAGKSTLGLSTPRGRLLADELVGVRGRTLMSTPFWGDFRAGVDNGARRLEAVFLLDRRAPRGVRPVPRSEALARILECALVFLDDPAAARGILAAARKAVEAPTFVVSYDARRTSFAALEALLKEALA